MWPIAVAGDLGRYLLTTSVVRPGQDWKTPFFIALSHVVVEGLNAAACRKATKSGSDLVC